MNYCKCQVLRRQEAARAGDGRMAQQVEETEEQNEEVKTTTMPHRHQMMTTMIDHT